MSEYGKRRSVDPVKKPKRIDRSIEEYPATAIGI
jgi:hypothetical protein